MHCELRLRRRPDRTRPSVGAVKSEQYRLAEDIYTRTELIALIDDAVDHNIPIAVLLDSAEVLEIDPAEYQAIAVVELK